MLAAKFDVFVAFCSEMSGVVFEGCSVPGSKVFTVMYAGVRCYDWRCPELELADLLSAWESNALHWLLYVCC